MTEPWRPKIGDWVTPVRGGPAALVVDLLKGGLIRVAGKNFWGKTYELALAGADVRPSLKNEIPS